MKKYVPHITISVIAILLAVGHLIWPNAKIDAITIILIAIAVLPWLGSIFKSIELPGGVKVEYKDLEKAKEQAEKAGLLATPSSKKEEPAYLAVAEHDPNLALAGLRIEIERRLQTLARANRIESKGGMGNLLRQLFKHEVLSSNEMGTLADMTVLLNSAVHGADVDQRAALWAFEIGPQLLAGLDERINKIKS
jgi:hypothetical protein